MSNFISSKWDRFRAEQQFLAEAQQVSALYEQELITEGEFWDRLTAIARKHAVPIALAAALTTGLGLGAKAQTDRAWQQYEERIEQARSAGQEALASYVTPHASKWPDKLYQRVPGWRMYGDFVFIHPDKIDDDEDLGYEVGERTAGEFRKSLQGHTSHSLEKMLSGTGGQWALAAQDLDGDGTISDAEALTLIYDKDKKGRQKLPLKWSLTWEKFQQLQADPTQ